MAKILVTGFTPFADRSVNASWLAARWLAENHPSPHLIHAALLPVVWGVSAEIISELVKSYEPDLVIAMGEGHRGRFAIETRARNQRSQREDNSGRLPATAFITEQGSDHHICEIDADSLCIKLVNKGYPAQKSDDAGAFICEETLYFLESLRRSSYRKMQVVFCHLPPFGTELQVADQPVVCDQPLLSQFASDLLQTLTAMSDH